MAAVSRPRRRVASGWPGLPTGYRPSAGRCSSTASPVGGPPCAPRSRSLTMRPRMTRGHPSLPQSAHRMPPMPEPLQVVIADDNYLVREGTRRLLEDAGEVVVLAAVGSAPELLDAVRRCRPDAVLTDIRMPPLGGPATSGAGASMEGIEAAHAIRAADPKIGVAILSQYADESYAFELFRNGTAGLAYLLKDRVGDLGQLLAALRAVADGESVVDPQVVDALVTRRSRLRESPLSRLTPRELDVLREMAQGRGNAGIAAELSLSESSVEKYVNAIFSKLDLASEQLIHRRVAAVLTFLRDAGLRPPG